VIERSAVTWGSTEIPYRIRRSARRATVSLAIEPGAGLLVTAPSATPLTKLDAVVRSRANWVTKRLRTHEPTRTAKEFVSGETFFYLGRQYRLDVRLGNDVAPLHLLDGRLTVVVPDGVPTEHRSGYVRASLIDWYRRRARSFIPDEVRDLAAKVGVASVDVVIADQSRRWGSCSAGVVRINWRVMQAPKRLVEYVLAHEAVHLIHDHHGPRFWAALGRLMPDYEVRRAKLRDLGERFIW
jgi:predicted metal-dependent hydrolase